MGKEGTTHVSAIKAGRKTVYGRMKVAVMLVVALAAVASAEATWSMVYKSGACLDSCKHLATVEQISMDGCKSECTCEGSATCTHINYDSSSKLCNLKACSSKPVQSQGAVAWQCHSYKRSTTTKPKCSSGAGDKADKARKSSLKSRACGFHYASASSYEKGTNRAEPDFDFSPKTAIMTSGAGKDVFWQSKRGSLSKSKTEWWIGSFNEVAYVITGLQIDWHSAGASKIRVYSSPDKKKWTLRYSGKGGRCPGLCVTRGDRTKARQTIPGWRGETHHIKIEMSGFADNTYPYYALHHVSAHGLCGDKSLMKVIKADTKCLAHNSVCVMASGKKYSMSLRTLKNGQRYGHASPEVELVFVPAQKTLTAAAGIERSAFDRWVLYDGIAAKVLATTQYICGNKTRSNIVVLKDKCTNKPDVIRMKPASLTKSKGTPVVAVYAHRSTEAHKKFNCGGDCDAVPRSVVDWLESTGARVVPLPHHSSRSYLAQAIAQSDALMLPGGDWHYLDRVSRAQVQFIYRTALAQNRDEKGRTRRVYPILGICTGMQFILNFTAHTPVLSKGFKAGNLTVAQQFTEPAKESNFVRYASERVIKALKKPVVLNKHWLAITPKDFANSKSGLADNFLVVAHQQDRRNATFVSIVEGKEDPVLAVQFHPEVNAYEFGTVNGLPFEAINHKVDAVLASKFLATYFVNSTQPSKRPKPTSGFKIADWDVNKFSISRTGPQYQWTYFINVDEKGWPIRGRLASGVAEMTDKFITQISKNNLGAAERDSRIKTLQGQVKALQSTVQQITHHNPAKKSSGSTKTT